jgi:hypothetical protein
MDALPLPEFDLIQYSQRVGAMAWRSLFLVRSSKLSYYMGGDFGISPVAVCTSGVAQPDMDLACFPVDEAHEAYLSRALSVVVLVDADRISPKVMYPSCATEFAKHSFEIVGNYQMFAIA